MTCEVLSVDDEWDSKKLQLQVEFHKNNPKILMSYTDERWVRDSKEIKIPKKFRKYGGDIFERCLSHCIIAPSATMIHKSLLKKVGNFDESLEICEDYDLWLRVALQNEIGLVDEKLITKYAGHNDQLSFKHWGMDRFRVIALEKLLESSKKDMVIDVLLQKYRVLLKGAVKYDRIDDMQSYTIKIKNLERYT
jgi:hypothetical protein